MKSLDLYTIEKIDHIVTPENYEHLTLDSSALEVFTDFREFHPLVVDADTKAVEAKFLMQKSHLNLKIVLNSEMRLCGVIGLEDLSEQRLVTEVSKGKKREDILVTDLMLARADMMAFDYNEIRRAQVHNILSTLKDNNLQYCLVVDHEAHEIRGIISANEIARKLNIPLLMNPPAGTFAEVFSALH
ncbi:CBS domain-containing protein [Leucothrix sargassi]|nr:CBS domain-containing protein [Leucothrix sargassi]